MRKQLVNETVVAELRRIADDHNGIAKPEDVVLAASVSDNPLHAYFEWDDTEAGRKYRLWQARDLLRVVVSYEQVGPGKTVPCRVFVSLTPDREENGGGYRVTTSVMADATLRAQLLSDARSDMKRFRDKYNALEELSDVFAAMDAASEPEPAIA